MALRVTQAHVSALFDEPAEFDGSGALRVTQAHVSALFDEPAGFDGSGVLRVTQAHISALFDEPAGFDGSGLLRITQAHVSVLADLPPDSATDAIDLSEAASAGLAYTVTAADTIGLSEVGSAGPFTFDATAGDALALGESAGVSRVKDTSAEETITLLDFGVAQRSLLRDATDSVALSETASASRAVFIYAIDTLALSEGPAADDGTYPAQDIIILAENAQANWEGNREASDTVAIFEAASYILIAGKITEEYRPQVGGSSDPNAPTPPPTVPPTLTPGTVLLEYPFDAPTTSVSLRRPAFGNRDRLTSARINRTTRGNTLIVYADNQWPKVHTLVMDFRAIKEADARAYLDFVGQSLGQETRLTDWEGRAWRGVIVQPDEPMVRDFRDGNTLSLVFEGELA